ncbi:MAG: hypothetical protein ABI838_08055 [Chloroflexota bacterium]
MDDRLDQRILAQLWELENSEQMERRVELSGERHLSLFLEKLGGRSYIFRHGLTEQNEAVSVGQDSEFWMYETAEAATIEFDRMVAAARRAGHLVETDDEEGLGDPHTDGPNITDVGVENLRNT